ncbi:4572_t:CDS:2 [Dentiscutata heterogama]|uniref:4572_t:CDS:1 n=1 Tax=Dentiscutata heterogama TaxID=1316150 RepID=A0ACA9KE53_9GLOM|nr:4572_t:CDS:2 [Dentiscutata heterogama]
MWRWKTEKLKQELKNYNIGFEANTICSELITLLNNYLYSEMIDFEKIQDKENENIDFIRPSAMNIDRRGGKCILPNIVSALKTFFMASQLDQSNRFMAKDMVNRLQEMVKNDKISENDKISTEQAVKSWISRFSKSSKELSASEVLTSETSA